MAKKGTPHAERSVGVQGPPGGNGAAPPSTGAPEFFDIPNIVKRRKCTVKRAIEWVEANLFTPWEQVDLERAPSPKALVWLACYGKNQERRAEFVDKYGPHQLKASEKDDSAKGGEVDGSSIIEAIDRLAEFRKRAEKPADSSAPPPVPAQSEPQPKRKPGRPKGVFTNRSYTARNERF